MSKIMNFWDKTNCYVTERNSFDNMVDLNSCIIIDNGSYECRAGCNFESKPRLVFRNTVAKSKSKKGLEEMSIIGSNLSSLDNTKFSLKSQFERNIVVNFDIQEKIFDYVFSCLLSDTDDSINYPLILTEPICNPNYSKQKMMELLFECYRIPDLCHGVDSLFSYYNNFPTRLNSDHLILSFGYQTIHIIPVINGIPTRSRRLNYGGYTLENFLQTSLQLKYPNNASLITSSRAEELVMRCCHISLDYQEELLKWTQPNYYNEKFLKFQLPFNHITLKTNNEEKVRDQQAILRKRLKDINEKRRQQNLYNEEGKLKHYLSILETVESEQQEFLDEENDDSTNIKDIVNNILLNNNLSSMNELKEIIKKLTSSVKKIQDKIAYFSSNNSTETQDKKNKSKKMKLEKFKYIEMPARNSEEATMQLWVESLKNMKQDVNKKISEQRQKQVEMMKRGSRQSAMRMKIITQLTDTKSLEDDFGKDDEDWNVYKEISKESLDSDIEEDLNKLEEINFYLQQYDKANYGSEGSVDQRECYQVHMAIEQIRIPELFFEPSMMGLEQCGLAEAIEHTLNQFSSDQQISLTKNIFITGGPSKLNNLNKRLATEIQQMLPFESKFCIDIAKDPSLDAWNGAKLWSLNEQCNQFKISLNDYQEKGLYYLEEFTECSAGVSNKYVFPKKFNFTE